ncbi:MAG: carotenoid oxygenase family protein [Acidimicrobiales bacterium]
MYLEDHFAPVVEEVTAHDLTVYGELPTELCGRYLRNGPNPFEITDPAKHHWFLGDGMVHGLRLRDGHAEWYRNRYVGSAAMSARRGIDDIAGPNWNGGATGPNTNAGGFAGTTWATVEAGACPVELDYELETVGRNDFHGTLPRGFTAHPKIDPVTGEMHAMTYAYPQFLDSVQYVVVGTDGRVRHSVDVPLESMTMMHDMSLTDRYAVVYDQPVTVNFDAMTDGYAFPFRWNPDTGNRVGLLPRAGTADQIIWVDVPLAAHFHPMNAYDTADGRVVIDICAQEKMFDIDVLGPWGEPKMPRLERWDIDPLRRTSSVTVIDESPNEFPRHRHSVGGNAYRYGYSVSPSFGGMWATLKHDLVTGERQEFDHGLGRASGEPVFIAREGSVDEDDGWLVTFVHDGGRAEFVVIDAQDFSRGYVARVELPQRVPFGFHGNWVSDRSVPPS